MSRGSDPASCPAKPLGSYHAYRQLHGWILPPLEICAVGARGYRLQLRIDAHEGVASACADRPLLRVFPCRKSPFTACFALCRTCAACVSEHDGLCTIETFRPVHVAFFHLTASAGEMSNCGHSVIAYNCAATRTRAMRVTAQIVRCCAFSCAGKHLLRRVSCCAGRVQRACRNMAACARLKHFGPCTSITHGPFRSLGRLAADRRSVP